MTTKGRQEDGPAEASSHLELTVRIVESFVRHNTVSAADLPHLIANVSNALKLAAGDRPPVEPEELKPAVPVRRSIMDDYLVCLEDGKRFKSLKRHLRTQYNMTPEDYRERWGLPHDYPMVAPNYAKERSALAKKMGLGTRRDP